MTQTQTQTQMKQPEIDKIAILLSDRKRHAAMRRGLLEVRWACDVGRDGSYRTDHVLINGIACTTAAQVAALLVRR